MDIGKRIEDLLQQQDITQRELAKRVGVTETTMSRYIHCLREPKGSILQKIAQTLNTTTDYLLGESKIPQEDMPLIQTAIIALKRKEYLQVIQDAESAEVSPETLRKLIDIYKKK